MEDTQPLPSLSEVSRIIEEKQLLIEQLSAQIRDDREAIKQLKVLMKRLLKGV